MGLNADQADFFMLAVPRCAAERAFGPHADLASAPSVTMVLDRARDRAVRGHAQGARLLPFPHASLALAMLCLDDGDYLVRSDDLRLSIPRVIFDEIADETGAERIGDLPLALGMAAGDPVMVALDRSLRLLLESGRYQDSSIVEGIANSLNVHLAEHYGRMRRSLDNMTGGLAPWQLRLATRTLRNFGAPSSLEDIAGACGLSVGHFSRAFKKSTGSSPHQWVMYRRVEAAKELIVGSDLPLAEIALACHFSDQSHLTRAFASATGMTPARWRAGPNGPANAAA